MSLAYTGREAWGALYGKGYAMSPGAKLLVVAHHAGSPDVPPNATPDYEAHVMRERLELYQVRTLFTSRPVPDRHIGYNWVVMPSGRVYEGVGWGRIGAHAPGVNSRSYGVCICMNAVRRPPTEAATHAFRSVISEGLRLGYIAAEYRIAPHSEFKDTTCPGHALRTRLQSLRPEAAVSTASMPVLRAGSAGAAVAKLQKLLGMGDVPAAFGPRTLAAVKKYQLANGLEPDGVVGPATWASLLRERSG